VRYWDSSAIVPLVVQEPGTDLVRDWVASDDEIVTWAMTRVELVGAIQRRAREGRVNDPQRRSLLARLGSLFEAWGEATDVLAVRTRALPLLARHPLRAADAAQLGAALLLAEGDPGSLPFVCLDRNLALAAEREGFPILTWPEDA
jgi:hypothetical protein